MPRCLNWSRLDLGRHWNGSLRLWPMRSRPTDHDGGAAAAVMMWVERWLAGEASIRTPGPGGCRILGYASHPSVDSAIRRIEAVPRPLKRKAEAVRKRITND